MTPVLGKKKKQDELNQIYNDIMLLKNSPLYSYRIKEGNLPVVGGGDSNAQIIFVGEAPGKNEAKTGKPFCGAAGKKLDEVLAFVKISREEVYITNIVKDRPPENRDPTQEEIDLYAPFLDRQINIIQPKIIATLGRFSMVYILNMFGLDSSAPISVVRGKVFEVKTNYGEIKIIPMYHPAATIYNQHLKEDFKKDFKTLKKLLK